MGTEFRILLNILIETLNSLKRTHWMNWVIISTMAAILTLFGCMFRFTIAIDNLVKHLGSELQISVYLEDGTDPKVFLQKLKELDNIKQVNYIPKEQAWKELKKLYSMVDITNPLPDTIHIKLSKDIYVQQTVDELNKFSGIENIYYPQVLAKQIKKISDTTTIITILFVIFLGGLTLFIISNTIQLQIQSCSREIDIMSMMGVSGWYIKTPFILQGAFYGFCGSIIALIPLHLLQGYIIKIYHYFNSTPSPFNLNVVVLSILVLGVFVGATGSIISVRKFLKT